MFDAFITAGQAAGWSTATVRQYLASRYHYIPLILFVAGKRKTPQPHGPLVLEAALNV